MKLPIKLFKGAIPKLTPTLLPDGAAQLCLNANLCHGELRPLAALKGIAGPMKNQVRGLYTEDGTNFYTWTDDVYAVRTPNISDIYGRFYYTIENGSNPGFYVYTKVGAFGGGVNPLGGLPDQLLFTGVPKPTNSPTLVLTPGSNLPSTIVSTAIKINFFYESGGVRYQEVDDIAKTFVTSLERYMITIPEINTSSVATTANAGNMRAFAATFYTKDSTGNKSSETTINDNITVLSATTLTYTNNIIESATGFTDSGGIDHELVDFIKEQQGEQNTPSDAVPCVEVIVTDTTNGKNDVLLDAFSVNSASVGNSTASYGGLPTINMTKVATTGFDYYVTADYPVFETRAYIYTLVNAWGEESVPSEPELVSVTFLQNVIVNILMKNDPAYKEQTKARIYRSISGTSGEVNYQLVGEQSLLVNGQVASNFTNFQFTDNVLSSRLQEVIPSTTWDCPPKTLKNITAMPNGILAAFTGNQLYFCDPYHPFAWPVDYIISLPYDIVGLQSSAAGLLVTTKAYPYMVSGSHPEAMSSQKLPILQAGISARGMADMGNAIAYVSRDGICMVTYGGYGVGETGSMQFSQQLFAREDWRNKYDSNGYSLSQMKLGVYDGALIGSFPSQNGFFIRLDEDAGTYSETSVFADAVFLLPQTDQYMIAAGSTIFSYNEGITPLTFQWWSKDALIPRPTNFGAIQIIASPNALGGGSLTVEVISDGVVRDTRVLNITTASQNNILRLSSGFKARRWSVRLTGNCYVKEMTLASTIRELQVG